MMMQDFLENHSFVDGGIQYLIGRNAAIIMMSSFPYNAQTIRRPNKLHIYLLVWNCYIMCNFLTCKWVANTIITFPIELTLLPFTSYLLHIQSRQIFDRILDTCNVLMSMCINDCSPIFFAIYIKFQKWKHEEVKHIS